MRLLVVTQKYDFNDSNLGIFIKWWDKIAEKTDKVYVLALEKRSKPIRSNIEVVSMGKENGVGFFGKIFGFYRELFGIIDKTDAILIHMVPKYVILAAPAAFIYKKPIYLWYTGVAAHWQLRLAVIFCRKVFTAHGEAMRINTPKRIITGHGIDVEKFVPAANLPKEDKIPQETTILSVGRITSSKGHDLVIRAVSDLIKSGYNLKLKIIGGVIQSYHENYLTFLKRLARELKIADRVEFTGAVSYSEMPQQFNNTDIIINAVPFGGLDKVVLEAMASGVLPLTSNSAFSSVFPESFAKQAVFKKGDFWDLKNKLKNILDKKIYKDRRLRLELRNIIIKNHNLENLILRIIKEIEE